MDLLKVFFFFPWNLEENDRREWKQPLKNSSLLRQSQMKNFLLVFYDLEKIVRIFFLEPGFISNLIFLYFFPTFKGRKRSQFYDSF